ncbi:MAG: RNA pyrophosphohydrolase [Pseudomonadota bacterium]|nr:RNA pyrophosphohydrolase [Pseudomonadota bacterium]
MIDEKGFRLNVGLVICNDQGEVFWGRRVGQDDSWQFPQGGIDRNEPIEQCVYRELWEEVGLMPKDVEILGSTKNWLYYNLPDTYQQNNRNRHFVGQKQRWFLLKLNSDESAIDLNRFKKPEFADWRWVSYWYPIDQVIFFKQQVYRLALSQLYPLLPRPFAE